MAGRKRKVDPWTTDQATVYRVFIDYASAGLQKSSSGKDRAIYHNRAGVNALIKSAMQSGVHPRHIHVSMAEVEWKPAPDYHMLCPTCGSMYDSPNDECPAMAEFDRINIRREGLNIHPHLTGRYPPIPLPHPVVHVIDEQPHLDDA